MTNQTFVEFGPLDHFFARRVLEKENAFTEERALFLRFLMHHSRQGHLCFVPPEELASEAAGLPLSIMEENPGLFPKAPIIRYGDSYYLQKNWVLETYILQQIERLKAFKLPPFYDESLFLQTLQLTVEQKKLLPEQGKAILSAFQNSFSLICGGPGTGKTYTAGYLVRLFLASLKKEEKKQFKLVLAAPTGKAAAHLQTTLLAQGSLDSALKMEASTLHRLLRLQPGENRLFSGRRIDADLVLVDEASMLDVPLLAHLLEAIGEDTKLVLMGDPNQLPPIEAGSLFAEMTFLFGSPLQKPLRTEDAHLQTLAQAINRGDVGSVQSFVNQSHLSWVFDETCKTRLFEAVNPHIAWKEPDPKMVLKEFNRFRVLGALRQGPYGIDVLNRQIVEEIARKIKPGQWWVVPILITSNEPRLGLYNGSCGVLIGKCKSFFNLREGVAYFPDEEKPRAYTALPPFEVAFCLSVHKSQGSEFDRVLALFPPGSENFGREALYTAVTRAKKQVNLGIDEDVLKKMLAHRSQKISGFTDRIRKIDGRV